MERDAEIAARTGQPIRADIQLARQLIIDGGFTGLFEALKRGAALPVVALLTLARLLQEGGTRQDE